jgi:hypothetical protein
MRKLEGPSDNVTVVGAVEGAVTYVIGIAIGRLAGSGIGFHVN